MFIGSHCSCLKLEIEKVKVEANCDQNIASLISDFKLRGQISRLAGISEKSFSMQNKWTSVFRKQKYGFISLIRNGDI